MDVKSCENCEQMIDRLEESFVYQGHVVCKKCKNILEKQAICLRTPEEKSCNGFSEERKPNKKTSYILKHWRGELSLVVSFWVNIFLLNIVIVLFWTLLNISGVVKNPVIIARVVMIVMTFTFFPIYPWQFIGLWRCCSRHIKIRDKYFWARTAQVVIVFGFIAMLSNLTLRWPIYKGSFRIAFCKDNDFGDYTLTLEKNNTIIHLQGGLGFGVSKKVSRILENNRGIEGIILDSIGGRIYEGRELAKLITAYRLDTYSLDSCCSAGTIAFIAGKKRFLGTGANLAYHQYKMAFKGLDDFGNMQDEQDKDILFFEHQGVKKEFIERLYLASPDDLWYPTVDEMLDAGVIHGIVNSSDLLPVDYNLTSSKEIEETLLNIPVYATIQKYDPNVYNEIKAEFDKQIKKGATLIELQSTIANFIRPLADASLSLTSDEAAIQFIQAFIASLNAIIEINPILGLKMLYPEQYGGCVVEDYLPADKTNLMLEAMNKVIIDAYKKDNPSIDVEAGKLLIVELVPKLGEHYDYLELEGLQNSEDYKKHCEALIKFYELILAEDKVAAGNVLRYIFSLE